MKKSAAICGGNKFINLGRVNLMVFHCFSRYLYVCATTVCVYIGVTVVASTGAYTYLVLALRKREASS